MEFNHKILVVDDEPNLRTTLSLILQRDGYVVTTAGGADEAHEKLQAQAFDLVFLDIKMPKKSGLMLLTEIKQLFPDLPVLLLTAFASLDSAIEAVRRGAADYLLKPIDPPQILSRVRQVLSEQQPNRRRAIMNEMQRLLGVEGNMQQILGLESNWGYNVVKQVGNYAEILERNLGKGTRLAMDRGMNKLLENGGAMVAPAFR